jgi:glutathione S-transferase
VQASGRFRGRRFTFSALRLRSSRARLIGIGEAERHYQVLDDHLAGRRFMVGAEYSIVDMSACGWISRASVVLTVDVQPLAPFPNLKKWFEAIDARP